MADGKTSRSTYTFTVTLDLTALTLPTNNTSMVYGGEKVGFGLDSTGLVTAAIGSGPPKWSSTGVIVDTEGSSLTLIVSTGASGSIIAAYGDYSTDTTKQNANNRGNFTAGTTTAGGATYSWNGLKEGGLQLQISPLTPPLHLL